MPTRRSCTAFATKDRRPFRRVETPPSAQAQVDWGEFADLDSGEGPKAVAELEETFLRGLQTALRLDPAVFARRPFTTRLLENACRLLSPLL
jgi:hypothetical protein